MHGTYSMYTNGKCRCDECREAAREYARKSREKKRLESGEAKRKPGPQRKEEHSYSGYVSRGCRCDICKEAARAYRQSRKVGLPEGDPRHGTTNGYTNWGCRCSECKRAIGESRKAAPPLEEGDHRHGTLNGYFTMKCRCDKCRDSATQYGRDNDRGRKAALRNNYGLTLEQWDELFESQGGKCAICGEAPDPAKRRFHVDHNHTTGAVRGILCHNCNLALGHSKESKDRLQAMIEYLD